jgi:hypothetical protein
MRHLKIFTMKKYLLLIMLCPAVNAFAQAPEDALRYGWYPQNGTARNLAIGGVMGSLGGDITATYVNPAGLGFYKTREFVFTPGFFLNKQKSDFRQTSTTEKKNAFGFGPTGIVIGSVNRYQPKNSTAFSIAISQTANFNNTIRYKGLNNYSSFSEQFAEEFAKSGLTIDEVLNTLSPLPYTSALGLQTFLIDTVRVAGLLQVRGAPEAILDAGKALRQEMYKTTSGGIYELALAGAINKGDKLFFGGTLGIPIVNYKSNTEFTESDTSADNKNGFKSFTYKDNFQTTGVGLNLKLGAIYKPEEYIRLGLALHTPSLFFLTDEHTADLTTNLETPSGAAESFSESSNLFTNGQPGESRYLQSSAWKAIISGAYVFREVENVQKQKGFISADIEYVNHRGSRFSSDAEVPTEGEKAYYKELNNVVKNLYKGAFNFKVGGEVKFNIIMARLGFAYYTNPYKDPGFKANRMLLSGGLGYRHKGVFVDLTYVHNMSKDADFPYRLQDRANTFASTKQTLGNVMATVGWKF